MSQFCTECGAKLSADARFCPGCGAVVQSDVVGGLPVAPQPVGPVMAPVMYVPVYSQQLMPPRPERRPRVRASVVMGGVTGILGGLSACLGAAGSAISVMPGITSGWGWFELGSVYGRLDWTGGSLMAALSVFLVVVAALAMAGRAWCRVVLIAYAALGVFGLSMLLLNWWYYDFPWLIVVPLGVSVLSALLLALPSSSRFFDESSAARLERERSWSNVAAKQPRMLGVVQ